MPRHDRYSYHHAPRIASIPFAVLYSIPAIALIGFAGLVWLFVKAFAY